MTEKSGVMTTPFAWVRLNMLRAPRLRLAILLLALAGAAALALLWATSSRTTVPKDQAVRDLFQKRRAVFHQLRDMIMSEPSLRGIGPDYIAVRTAGTGIPYWHQDGQWITDPMRGHSRESSDEILGANQVPGDWYAKYLRLLRDVEGDRLEWDDWSGIVRIWLGATGIAPSGQIKSVVFFPEGVPPGYVVVGNTDTQTRKGDYCSPLDDQWYIELRCW